MIRFRYVSSGGERIVVECPWEHHSGRIPPPTIYFGDLAFVYAGDDEDGERR